MLNEQEIEDECRLDYERQEREKERIWTENGKRWPTRRASWEVYWKKNQMKRNERSRGGVDNMRYTYEVIEPHLIPFWEEIQV